jgi:hypothetical protein
LAAAEWSASIPQESNMGRSFTVVTGIIYTNMEGEISCYQNLNYLLKFKYKNLYYPKI